MRRYTLSSISTALTAIALFSTPLAAQADASGAAPMMVTTPRYLFVLRGDMVYQFNVDTLELRNCARLTDPSPVAAVEKKDTAAESRPPVPGGARASAKAVESGLHWLAQHQDDDGKWDADEFMKHDGTTPATDGPGNATHDVGVTGLALLAFLGEGNTLRAGPHRANVKKAVHWLRGQQQDNGLIGTNASHDFIYDHAIATTAMCEAYGLSQYDVLKAPAQRALDYLEAHRNPYMVWRYQPRDNDNDTSVTTWCLMACRSGSEFGLKVNSNVFQLGSAWLDQVTETESGRVGYTKAGERSSRFSGKHSIVFPPDKGEALTAAGLFARYLVGDTPDDTPVMTQSADLLLTRLPQWDDDGSIDEYYWFFGSLAMYQIGGRHWDQWRERIRKVGHQQRQDGAFSGSWDPVGVWGKSGGRVYSTALLTLALESAYRYARVLGR